jgi:tryptophan synthase alpha chain
MSRLAAAFERMGAERRAGLVTYTTAGDPDLARSGDVLLALDRAGADVLEVGVPFSDPLADGPVIQRATERALAAGVNLRGVLDLVQGLRARIAAPIVIFSYANPLMRMGIETFARRAAAAGVDGVLALDLPIEEAGAFRETLGSVGLDVIFLLSPTTTEVRIRRAAELGSGFLYGISRLGVTGARDRVASGAEAMVRRIRAHTSLPIAVGFGVSSPQQVAEIGAFADAAVVGSALVSVIAEHGQSTELTMKVEEYVRWLKQGSPGGRGPRSENEARSGAVS